MPKRAGEITKQYLINAPLPVHGSTYTVIPHQFIIEKVIEQLTINGFSIERELYRCNLKADVAQGVYHLKYKNEADPDMGMMFAWSNSYDKSMRFKCAIGGYVSVSNSAVLSGDMGLFGRKHTGTADEEAIAAIHSQLSNAEVHFSELLSDKKHMKGTILSKRQRAEFLGRLYAELNVLSTEQITIVRDQMKNPKYDYNCEKDSLWAFYNHIIYSLSKSHPRSWMDHQRLVHWFLMTETNSSLVIAAAAELKPQVEAKPQPVVIPNQITLEQGIEAAEAEVEETKEPIAEEETAVTEELQQTAPEEILESAPGDLSVDDSPPPIDL